MSKASEKKLRAEIEELRLRLEEAEQALEAIRTGQVESLVIDGPEGPRIFSLEGASHSYRVLVEAMNEGAATLREDGALLYCNGRLAQMLSRPLQRTIGSMLHDHVPQSSRAALDGLLERCRTSSVREEIPLLGSDGEEIPVHLSIRPFVDGGRRVLCLVATDLRNQKRHEATATAERAARESEARLRVALDVAEQAQRALREREERLAVTLRSIGDAVIATDAAGRVTILNGVAEELTGYRDEEAIGRPVSEVLRIVNEVTREPAESPIDRVLREGVIVGIANHAALIARDGTERPIADSGAPIRDREGQVLGVVLVFRDQTSERRAAEALRRSEGEARARAAQLEAVLDCIADGVLVYDREGRTVRSTPAADAIVGLSPAEREAPVAQRVMRQYEILTEDGRRLGPEEMIAVRAAVHGERVPGTLLRVRSGTNEPRWLIISGMPLFVDGEHAGAVLSMTDVTERKRAEENLAIVSRLYAVLSGVNEAIVRTKAEQPLYDEVCRIVTERGGFPLVWVGLVEEREVVPVASSGIAAEYLRELRVEVQGELGSGPTGRCIREERPVINDDFDVNPATWPWRESTLKHGLRASAAFPLRREGKAIGALTLYAGRPGAFTPDQVKLLEALCADLSYALDAMHQERLRSDIERALREREQSLRDADRRKDEFLGMLSHELRNPLAPIRNSIYILRHAAAGSEQARRAQDVIERQTNHLSRLVDDLLDVTRIARGKIELRRERIDLRDVVSRAGEDFGAIMNDRGLAFRTVLPEEKLWAEADRTRVTQVIGNLLHNAAKFTRRGGTITLSLQVADGSAEIRVRDTGAGIDAALLPHMFDPFIQGARTLARSEGGLGLGLALVKGIAELHGGAACAESAGVGQGAQFTVRLPLAAGGEVADAFVAGGAGTEERRVLVVDDNVDAAQTLADLIGIQGHRVQVAFDGPSALELAQTECPDVVFCDLGLPGMSGYEVASALRKVARRPIRIYAVSGYAQLEHLQQALEVGFDGHLAKPCAPEQVFRLLA